jgi:uncharacterized protein
VPVMIFKAIETCNSNCLYCDVIKKHQNAIMSYDLLALVFQRINEYLEKYPTATMTMTWHGGEVCLLGATYFEKALDYQEQYCPGTKKRIEHLVQSNLTLVTRELIDAWKRLGIRQIGSSYEPIPAIRGFGKNRDSEAYDRKFMDGVALLEECRMYWGIIYVAHRQSLTMPLEIFYFLTNINLRTSPCLNMVWVYGEDKHNLAISPEEFAHFLGAIFPVWWKHRDRYPHVRPFEGMVRTVADHNFGLVCENTGACAYNWIYIGPEGHTSQCGKSGDYSLAAYGLIQDRSLDEILNDRRRDLIASREEYLPESECRDCRFWGICHGGCPVDSLMTYGDYLHRSPDCAATRIFMEKYFEPITGLRAEFPKQAEPAGEAINV